MKLISAEKKEKNQVELSILVGKEEFEQACERSYRMNVGKINIQGFRKGKAPRKIIEKLYGPEVFYEDATPLPQHPIGQNQITGQIQIQV